MFQDIDERVEQYKKEFQAALESRKRQREQEADVANLGRKVADRGFQAVLKEVAPAFDIEKLDEENHKLSEQVAKRVAEIDSGLVHMPASAAARRVRHHRTMQEVAIPHQHSGFLTPPAVLIIGNTDDPTDGSNRCEVTCNVDLNRIYPVLHVRGTGRDLWRDSEVVCDFIWLFTTDRTELHYVTPHIEYHGRRVFTVEHHCFHDAGASAEIKVLMDVNQDRWLMPTDEVSSFSPDHGRTDTWRWPNYPIYLVAGQRTYVVVRVILNASARSKYGTAQLNFGDPSSDNFIGMPYLAWLGASEI